MDAKSFFELVSRMRDKQKIHLLRVSSLKSRSMTR